MTSAGEIPQLNDCLLVTLDIEDSPSAEIPLADIYDMVTSTLLDNHREVFQEIIVQILEDTTWITYPMIETYMESASFGYFEIREEEELIISLRPSSLQRLISQAISVRDLPIASIRVPILIRFKSTTQASLPTKPTPLSPATTDVTSAVLKSEHVGPPSNVSEAEQLDQVSELPGISPVLRTHGVAFHPELGAATIGGDASTLHTEPGPVPGVGVDREFRNNPPFAPEPSGPSFRGNPVNIDRPTSMASGQAYSTSRGREYDSFYDGRPSRNPGSTRRPLFDHNNTSQQSPFSPASSTKHPFTGTVKLGATTFEEYMTQFQFSEVKYKDFRKVILPTFNSAKNDSFIHWYKLLTSTCLQWGVWCPPYESVEEDSICGAWWKLLPQSVRNQESFMGHLIYSLLIKPDTFPANSREIDAVEGSTANSGYNALYNILRMHHPSLHSVYSTANLIPQHRCTESFSLYSRRLQEFIAREQIAGRTYSESEALDLITRNVSSEWRSEFRRLVERDKHSGRDGTLPFKLQLPQIATTFVEYADELGREPPGSRVPPTPGRSPTGIMRRIETDADTVESDAAFLPDEDVDLIVNAISQNQQSSAVCLGCQQPGHTLTDCNRFVDYIVAESLALRHPTLRTQVANSHSHFRTRLNAANARARSASMPSGGNRPTPRTVRSIVQFNDNPSDSISEAPSDSIADSTDEGLRQHSIHVTDDDPDVDFEACFTNLTMNTIHVLGIEAYRPSAIDTVLLPCDDDMTDSITVRRLAATYATDSSDVYAHADNSSMACTAGDSKFLFAYRLLSPGSNVRLFDAGNNVHRPLGVGFLCIPTRAHGHGDSPSSVFIRTYHTPTISGIIVSHSAISKQLQTSSYHLSSHHDKPGFIHFPHRLRRSQDVFISIQPISHRGGLTFTEALILPSKEQHLAAIPPWPSRVHRLCSDHAEATPSDLVDPTDGMTCNLCHEPPTPLPDFR